MNKFPLPDLRPLIVVAFALATAVAMITFQPGYVFAATGDPSGGTADPYMDPFTDPDQETEPDPVSEPDPAPDPAPVMRAFVGERLPDGRFENPGALFRHSTCGKSTQNWGGAAQRAYNERVRECWRSGR